MKIFMGILGLMILLGLGACRKNDIRTVQIKTPGMTNAACAKVVQDAFAHQPGINSVRPDFQTHELTVTYNSMVVARKNLEFIVAGAGFDADDTPAFSNAVAKLPAECR